MLLVCLAHFDLMSCSEHCCVSSRFSRPAQHCGPQAAARVPILRLPARRHEDRCRSPLWGTRLVSPLLEAPLVHTACVRSHQVCEAYSTLPGAEGDRSPARSAVSEKALSGATASLAPCRRSRRSTKVRAEEPPPSAAASLTKKQSREGADAVFARSLLPLPQRAQVS
jgi:hypothetical protein